MKFMVFALSLFISANVFAQVHVGALAIDRTSYDFGWVPLMSSRSVTFTISNTGTTDLVPEGTFISGSGYSASHTCTRTLKPQETCRALIRFEPFFEGLQVGTFETYFSGDTGVVIRLWGRGQRF